LSSAEQFDVFLSHNSAQKDWTRQLATRLKADGFAVWFDEWQLPKHAGSNWIDLLSEGIEKSRKIVLIWSPEFFSNTWPEFEASLIQRIDPVGRLGRIVPVLHTECDIPNKWAFRQWLNFVGCTPGSHEFAFAYQLLVHNLDSSRFVVPDKQRYRPEKLEFVRRIRFLSRLWRWSAFFCGFWTLYWSFLLLASIGTKDWLGGYVGFVLFGISAEATVCAAVIYRGLHRLRPWGRRATIILAFLTAVWYPLSWYTLWILLRDEDASALYAEVSQDAR
jgi:hypothetical protein